MHRPTQERSLLVDWVPLFLRDRCCYTWLNRVINCVDAHAQTRYFSLGEVQNFFEQENLSRYRGNNKTSRRRLFLHRASVYKNSVSTALHSVRIRKYIALILIFSLYGEMYSRRVYYFSRVEAKPSREDRGQRTHG